MSITEFILARVAERESGARLGYDPLADTLREQGMSQVADWLTEQGVRVLAECKAKRKIVDLHHVDWIHDEEGPGGLSEVCGVCGGIGPWPYPCPTLRTLAAIWSDHAEFREEWNA